MKALLMIAVVLAGFLADEPEKPKNQQVTKADDRKTVKIAVGKAFDIALEGNPTTGFEWKLAKIDGDAVEQVGKPDYVQKKHPEGMVGVGGTYFFHFKVVKSAETKIKLIYHRPWEKDTPPAETFETTIDSK